MKFISNPKLRILHYISHPLLNFVNTITCLLKYFGGSLYRHWTDWKYYYLNVIPFKWTNCSVWMCYLFSSVQFSRSVMSDSWRPHEPQHTRPPCPSPNSQSLPKLMSIESVMPSNHLILCCPLLLLPSIFPNIRVFSNESALRIRWPKFQLQYQSFQWTLRTDLL